MTPAKRAALRELVTRGHEEFDHSQNRHRPSRPSREEILELLDDCDRLEAENAALHRGVDFARNTLSLCVEDQDVICRLTRERDEARALVRDFGAWDAVDRWDAEDAQAKKEGGG